MILKTSGNKIQKAFSRVSGQYEDLAKLQARMGDELLEKVRARGDFIPKPDPAPLRILDVGTGTARILPALQAMFPSAQVVGLDLAFEMLAFARSKEPSAQLIQADAGRLPFKENSFDLIVSNASYQWVADLNQAFALASSALKPGGTLHLAMFAHESLKELFATFEQVSLTSRGVRPRFKRLRRWEDIQRAAAKAGFKEIKSYQETRKIVFKDLNQLLRWLKGIGANTLGERKFIGRETLTKAHIYYRDHFGHLNGVGASFEIIWLEAVR